MSPLRTVLASALAALALAGTAYGAAPSSVTLSPSTAIKRAGTERCVMATVRDASDNPVPRVLVRFSVAGANTASGQKWTGTLGRARFCYTGTKTGTDTITAFVDTDRDGAKDASEPSRQATTTYRNAAPARVGLVPATDQEFAETERCVVATVRDAFGNPVVRSRVRFLVRGANPRGVNVGTNAYGRAPFCYTGRDPGEDRISAFADWDSDGIRDSSEPVKTATKTWMPAPSAGIVGPETMVFDWSEDKCDSNDIPDLPARAFRDYRGQVQLISTHYRNRRLKGPSLGQLTHTCEVVMSSGRDPSPAHFNDYEWLASPYTLNGRRVFALVHNEYRGNLYPGCPSGSYRRCWYNSLTLAVSTDGGDSYGQAPAPGHRVASAAYRYLGDFGPIGIRSPSNIVSRPGGYYYALVWAMGYGAQEQGTCLIRTKWLGAPSSWRAWGGYGFGVRFANPYTEDVVPGRHDCKPVSWPQINVMTDSLTFNTYLNRFVLVGARGKTLPGGRTVYGFYFSQSRDLIHWSERKLIKETELMWTYRCGDQDPLAYPSILDPASTSRNFETTGKRVWLFFTRLHYVSCRQTLDRDLLRVPLEFQK
jgi:Bacterial Ig-like domain (group 1)